MFVLYYLFVGLFLLVLLLLLLLNHEIVDSAERRFEKTFLLLFLLLLLRWLIFIHFCISYAHLDFVLATTKFHRISISMHILWQPNIIIIIYVYMLSSLSLSWPQYIGRGGKPQNTELFFVSFFRHHFSKTKKISPMLFYGIYIFFHTIFRAVWSILR